MSTTSSRNPFRDRLTPNATGSSTISQSANAPPSPRRPVYAPPTEPPPPPQQQQSRTPVPAAQPSPMASIPVINDLDVDVEDDLPPPYTVSADRYSGESTVEYGPARPFQPAPQPLLQVHPPPNQHQSQRYAPTIQSQRNFTPDYTGGPGFVSPAPPPRHPSTLSPSQAQRSVSEYRAPRSNIATMPGTYPPPHGPPSPIERRNSVAGSAPPTMISNTSSPSEPGAIPDDGKPTRMPVPGHPLLNNGRVLMYPPGYRCFKCENMGYKNFDPTHPCRKCWERYGKPYTGALPYATWSPAPANFQRPLPSFHPPSQPPPPSIPHGSRSAHSPPAQVAFTSGPAPPGAIVVQPGDPRIGGRLCWNCHGSGVVSVFFLFMLEEERCSVCNGMGRLFP